MKILCKTSHRKLFPGQGFYYPLSLFEYREIKYIKKPLLDAVCVLIPFNRCEEVHKHMNKRKTRKKLHAMEGVLHTASYELSHTDLPLKGKRHTESRHDVYKSPEINSL